MSTDLASARAALRAQSGDGISVYDHLSALLLKIVSEKPKEPLKEFESLSVALKQQRLRQKQAAATSTDGTVTATTTDLTGVVGLDRPSPALVSDPVQREAVVSYVQRTQDLLKKPKKFNEDGEEEEEEEEEINPEAPDIIQQANMIKQAGERRGSTEWRGTRSCVACLSAACGRCTHLNSPLCALHHVLPLLILPLLILQASLFVRSSCTVCR